MIHVHDDIRTQTLSYLGSPAVSHSLRLAGDIYIYVVFMVISIHY